MTKSKSKIIYCVTIDVDESINDEWLSWVQQTHIPKIINTGCFESCRINQLRDDENGIMTYRLDFLCPNQSAYDAYKNEFSEKLQREHVRLFHGKFSEMHALYDCVNEIKK